MKERRTKYLKIIFHPNQLEFVLKILVVVDFFWRM